ARNPHALAEKGFERWHTRRHSRRKAQGRSASPEFPDDTAPAMILRSRPPVRAVVVPRGLLHWRQTREPAGAAAPRALDVPDGVSGEPALPQLSTYAGQPRCRRLTTTRRREPATVK